MTDRSKIARAVLQLPNLRSLICPKWESYLLPRAVGALPRFTQLRSLEWVVVFKRAVIECLAPMTALTSLGLVLSSSTSWRAHISPLSRLPGLQKLQVEFSASQFVVKTCELQEVVGPMRQLRELVLSKWDWDVAQTDSMLASLTALTKLDLGNISAMNRPPETLLDDGFAALRGFSMASRVLDGGPNLVVWQSSGRGSNL